MPAENMSIEELIEQLKRLKDVEPEAAHSEADNLLLKFIGDARVTEAFEAIERWYS